MCVGTVRDYDQRAAKVFGQLCLDLTSEARRVLGPADIGFAAPCPTVPRAAVEPSVIPAIETRVGVARVAPHPAGWFVARGGAGIPPLSGVREAGRTLLYECGHTFESVRMVDHSCIALQFDVECGSNWEAGPHAHRLAHLRDGRGRIRSN